MTTVTNLIGLIGEADALESKRKVDQTLNTVIEQSGLLVSDRSHGSRYGV